MTGRWVRLERGRLVRAGRPVLCTGVNYHPSVAGCQYWRSWDGDAVRRDFEAMRAAGLNSVRFFLFWADFEPEPGAYDEECIGRLQDLVGMARDQGLGCFISLLTIWMNGQCFDLPWRDGRSLWTDASMVLHQQAYVRRIAEALLDFENVVAYDLGDEIMHVAGAEATLLPRDAVASWQRSLSGAICEVDPGALVMQANEASGLAAGHAFGPDNGAGLDLHAIHGYPTWAPFAIESTSAAKASLLPGFLVAMASAYGPGLIDELGTYGAADDVAADYLRAAGASSLINGANAVLVWCWQDIVSTDKPYRAHPGERRVGILDADGRPKPAMGAVQRVGALARRLAGLTRPQPEVGVYLAEHANGSPTSYLHAAQQPAAGAFGAFLLLKRAHLPLEFVTGGLERFRMVVCPSVPHLTLGDQERLTAYVRAGGTLVYSPGSQLHGFGGESLFGVRLRDFTLSADGQDRFTWNGHEYPIDWTGWLGAGERIPVVEAAGGQVLARYGNGAPALVFHQLGEGATVYVNAPYEAQLDVAYRLGDRRWELLYEGIADLAGVRAPVACDRPDVEVEWLMSASEMVCVAVNHSPDEATVTLCPERLPQGTQAILIPGKEIAVVTWPVPVPDTAVAASHRLSAARRGWAP